MKCEKCGTYIVPGEVVSYTLKVCICHKCGGEFSAKITGYYVGNIIYGNGRLIHYYKLTEKHSCPHCKTVFGGHEFYCDLHGDDNAVFEQLEVMAVDTHYKLRKVDVPVPQEIEQWMEKQHEYIYQDTANSQ